LRKRGACPKELQGRLTNAMREVRSGDIGSSIPEVLRQERVAVRQADLVLETREELGVYEQQRTLLAKLHDLYAHPSPVDLNIYFKCDRIYVYGLALIAAWCARYAANVSVSATDRSVERYLDRLRFTDFAQNKIVSEDPHYDSENHVALTPILRSRQDSADLIASRLVRLLSKHLKLSKANCNALEVAFAELVENVYRHADNDYPGFVIAQAHPRKDLLHIVMVDTGIGIYDSFRRSDREEVRQRAGTERDTLNMAVEAYVTSKTSNHSGYGLYVVSTLAAMNHGLFRLTSGRVSLLQQPTAGWRKRIERKTLEHLAWQGTELGLMFNLKQPLPLIRVYNTLERDAEDFFA